MVTSPDSTTTIETIRDARMDDCPVRALGHRAGVYYFLSPIGERREFRASDFTLNGVASLFEGDMTWMSAHFPRTDKKGNATDGYELTEAVTCLIAACAEKGLLSPNIAVRGVGVWRDGGFEDAKAGLVVHSGDMIFRTAGAQAFEKAGQMLGDVIYPAFPRIARIGNEASTAEDGAFLFTTIQKWKFRRPELDPLLVTGFIGQAALGGAPRWRAHMYVTGPKGSGKSWCADLVQGVLGGGAFDIKNNFTEAYLRQSMSGEARCLVLDEAENEPGGGRVGKVVELLRHMSSKDGAKTGRGGAGGTPMSGNVTGCAYLSSVLHVPLQPTDKSRITCIKIDPNAGATPEAVTQLEKDIAKLRELSPAFRRRMIDGWPRFLEAFALFRAAFMGKGLDSRGADQPATLLAGAWVLMNDLSPCTDSVEAQVELATPLLAELQDEEEDGEGQQCLNHLYSSFTDVASGGAKMTLGQLVLEAINQNDNKKIGAYGMRYEASDAAGEKGNLLIANQSVGLERLFANTRWGGKGWIQALEYIGCKASGKSARFGGAVSKAAIVPLNHWPSME